MEQKLGLLPIPQPGAETQAERRPRNGDARRSPGAEAVSEIEDLHGFSASGMREEAR
jgi:hypothetical protein